MVTNHLLTGMILQVGEPFQQPLNEGLLFGIPGCIKMVHDPGGDL